MYATKHTLTYGKYTWNWDADAIIIRDGRIYNNYAC